MIIDKRNGGNKLVSLVLVLIIVNTGFYGLSFEIATAQSEIPDYALQIAEQYKETDESYEIIETNNGVDKGYFVIIYYLDLGPGKKEITGSIIIDMTSQKLLDKNELSQSDFENILKFSSLVWHYGIDQEKALAKGQFFYVLSEDMYDAADDLKRWIGDGTIINVISWMSVPIECAHPVVLALKAYSIPKNLQGTAQIIDIQTHMLKMQEDYRDMGDNYEDLGYYWYRISEGKYEYADKLIPRSSGLDQTNINLYIDVLENTKYIASQDITAFIVGWRLAPEEFEYADQLKSHFQDINIFLEEESQTIQLDYEFLKSNYRFVGATTTGTISETVTSDSITVSATYSGNDDNDGSTLLYYKQHSSSSWLSTDGTMAKGYLNKQYKKTISGLSENAEYDVKVLYSDPDGVSPPNPIYKYRIKTAQSGGTPPSAPTLDDPGTTDRDGTYVVRWSYRVDATYYELEEAGANSQYYTTQYVSKSFSGKENGVYNYRVRACNDYGCSGWSNVESITVSLEPVSDNSYAGALYSGRVPYYDTHKEYPHGSVYKVEIVKRWYSDSDNPLRARAIIYKNGNSLGNHILNLHEMVYADDGNVQVFLKEVGIYKPSYEYGEDVAICTKTSSSDVNANPMIMCLAPGETPKISLTLPPGAYDEFYFAGSARDWTNRRTSTEAKVTVPSSTPDGTYTLSIMVMSGGVGLPVYSIKDIQINVERPNHDPNSPSNPTPVDGATDQPTDRITFSWSCSDPDPGDSLTYNLYFDSKSNPTTKVRSGISSSTIELNDLGLNHNQEYYWRVVAIDNDGASTPGPIWSFTTEEPPNNPPNSPSNPTPNDGASDQPINNLEVSWSGGDPDGDIVTYTVYADTNPNPSTLMGSVTSTSFIITGLSYSTTYYWKVVADDGKASPVSGPVWSFTTQAQSTNTAPNPPTSLNQYKSDEVTIPVGSTTSESTVVMKGSVSDPDSNDVQMEVEVRPVGTSFSNTSTCDSDPVPSGSTASAICSGLADGQYHWQARAMDSNGDYSDWVSFGGNPETSSDFIVDTTPTSPNIIYNGDFEIIDPSDSSNPDGWTLEVGGRDPPGWGLYKDVLDDYYYSGSHSVHFRLLGYSHLNCWGLIKSPLINNTQGDLVWYQSQATSFDSSDIEYTIKFYDENDNLISSNLYYTDTTTSQAGPGCGGGPGDSDMSPPAVIAENCGPACGGGDWYTFSSDIPEIDTDKFCFEIHIYQWEAPNKVGDGDACGSVCYVGFDNFCIVSKSAEEVIFADDFDTYATGSFPSSSGWNLKYNGYGNTYQNVDNSQSVSPPNSLKLEGQKNWAACADHALSETPDQVIFEVDVKVTRPDGGTDGWANAYVVLLDPYVAWGPNYGRVSFGAADQLINAKIPYNFGQWYHVKAKVDMLTRKNDVWIDDVFLGTFNITSEGYYKSIWLVAENSGHTRAWFDNVKVYKQQATVTAEKLTQLTTDPANEWQPAWSPDCEEIVFKMHSNPQKIIKLTLADSSELQLATHGWIHGNPCLFGEPRYSPDGTKIIYGKDDCNGWVDIYVVNSDGSSDHCITCSDPGENIAATWYPAENIIIYANAPNCCNMYPWDTISIKPDGSGKTTLVSGVLSERYHAMSPDESKLLYSAATYQNSPIWMMKIKDLDTDAVTDLDRGLFTMQTQSWQSQIFSPDGSKILYHSDENGNWDIYTINADGTGKTQLTTDTSDDRSAYFSPDGSKIVFVSDRTGNNDIWIMDADGSNKVQLTTSTSEDIAPSWSPTGNKIVFQSDRSGNYDIWLMELGTAPTCL